MVTISARTVTRNTEKIGNPLASESLDDILGPEPDEQWAHQALEFECFKDARARALRWSMHTGKSRAIIDKFCHQYCEGNILGAVVVAPNGVHLNWALNEIPRWHWANSHSTFAWETPKRADWDRQAEFKTFLAHPGMK